MGLSVISSPTVSQSAASSSNSTAAAQGLSGEFASLLSGEILSLVSSANLEKAPKPSSKPLNQIATTISEKESTLPGKLLNALATTTPEKDPKLSGETLGPIAATSHEKESTLPGNLLTVLAAATQEKDPKLSGETLSLIAATSHAKDSKLPGKTLNLLAKASPEKDPILPGETLSLIATTNPEKEPKLSVEDSLRETTDLLDPSLLTSQASPPTLQATISTPGATSFQAGTAKQGKAITETSAHMLAAQSTTPRPDQSTAEAADGETFGALEKLALSGTSSAQGKVPAHEAANFAAETTAADTNTHPQPSPIGALPTAHQPHEVLSTERANVSTHLRDASWPQHFGEKIVWLAKSNQQSAQININPPELGPVQITLNLNGDQAKVAFASPHAEVRQIIESALPQLKEMLSSAGISLGQANVGANLAQQNPDNPYQSANGKHLTDENAILPANDRAANTGTSSVLQRGRGLVDLFA